MFLVGAWMTRAKEIAEWGSSDALGSFVLGFLLLIIAVFVAHAGVIFFWRRSKDRHQHD